MLHEKKKNVKIVHVISHLKILCLFLPDRFTCFAAFLEEIKLKIALYSL